MIIEMKKFFIFASVALLALVSCKDNLGGQDPVLPVADGIRIEAFIDMPGTRATGVTAQSGRNDSSDESKINSLQVFVFNGDALDGYGTSTTNAATVSCTAGTRDVYAVVNAPALGSVVSKTALLAQVATLGNSATNFQMIGVNSGVTLQEGSQIPVTVSRHAARVVIKGIKNSLSNEAQASAFRILAVYLTNVAGDVDFGHSSNYSVANWYNKRGYQANNNLGAATYDQVNAAVSAGSTYATSHYFYSMPNGFEGAIGGIFTPRAARLVIKVEIAGNVYDYPILLPALQSNKSYEINMVDITRVGNLDDGDEPDDNHPEDTDEERPVEGFEQGFTITVNEWDIILLGDGNGNITI